MSLEGRPRVIVGYNDIVRILNVMNGQWGTEFWLDSVICVGIVFCFVLMELTEGWFTNEQLL